MLTQREIEEGLLALGLQPGAIVVVHSSLSSLGPVSGGANAVIDALIEALGPDGTLMMPTHPARDGRTFDPDAIPSDMGVISETFRLRQGVLRSRHPYHPVAGHGARAEEILSDHEESAVPDGPETPYGRLITLGGKVLHIGCDLDTMTLLHTVEAELDLPYLRELDMNYVGENGEVRAMTIRRCPGGHRGGVLKFDRLFRAEGAMAVDTIGPAVCRLIDAPRGAAIMRREMSRDPGFALDENPNCADCVGYREKIARSIAVQTAARRDESAASVESLKSLLEDEDFSVSVPLWKMHGNPGRTLDSVARAGVSSVEMHTNHLVHMAILGEGLEDRGLNVLVSRTPFASSGVLAEACEIASGFGAEYLHVRLPEDLDRADLNRALERLSRVADVNGMDVLVGNPAGMNPSDIAGGLREIGSARLNMAYDPAAVAVQVGSPFYMGLYKGPIRRSVRHVDFRDVVSPTGEPAVPGGGNAELVEIMSNLRCRSFDGVFCLWPLPGESGFQDAVNGLRDILMRI
ncbi:MAG: AAC(3) family N-acetyltransferase [Gemmatimonadota bacterium]|nr:AAC(3) family N-acetyltransferase [Gemmatimonadota bacterium]